MNRHAYFRVNIGKLNQHNYSVYEIYSVHNFFLSFLILFVRTFVRSFVNCIFLLPLDVFLANRLSSISTKIKVTKLLRLSSADMLSNISFFFMSEKSASKCRLIAI